MKQQHILALALLLAATTPLCGCSEDELAGTEPAGIHATLTVTVTDGGYASDASSSGPLTRTLENGYTTTFTAGDAIGVFAKKDDVVVNEVNNLRLTAKDNGSGGLVWTDDDGNALPKIPGATYQAYYPYREGLASDFQIGDWVVATDQGNHSKYTSQDLMSTAYSSPSGNTLSFTMDHQLKLVVLDLPRTKYTFNNTSPEIADYYMDAPDTKFNGFTPCRMSDGTYRYLMRPAVSTTLSGSYTNASGATVEWEFTPDLPAGCYKTYKVDGGSATIVTEKSHTLAIGDYYMKDGSLVGKDETLADQRKADCVGIVYYVGSITNDNYNLLNATYSHGLVVSLWNAVDPDNASNEGMYWTYGDSEFVQYQLSKAWPTSGTDGGVPSGYNIKEENKMQGYVNTIALEKYNAYVGASSKKRVKPIYALANFRKQHPAPSNSSDWYWPSVYELQQVCWGQGTTSKGTQGKAVLNTQIAKVSGTQFGDYNYWSSSDPINNSHGSNLAWCVNFSDGGVSYGGNKSYGANRVRPLLAF